MREPQWPPLSFCVAKVVILFHSCNNVGLQALIEPNSFNKYLI